MATCKQYIYVTMYVSKKGIIHISIGRCTLTGDVALPSISPTVFDRPFLVLSSSLLSESFAISGLSKVTDLLFSTALWSSAKNNQNDNDNEINNIILFIQNISPSLIGSNPIDNSS